MSSGTISSLEELICLVLTPEETGAGAALYRGVRSTRYPLIPGIGRHKNFSGECLNANDERHMLEMFKRRAYPFITNKSATDIEWLFLAQHHGLPTRLLDWTLNPLVACYFAVHKESDCDSALFVYHIDSSTPPRIAHDPFDIAEVSVIAPDHLTPRVTAQAGIFTIHPEPQVPFESAELESFTIPCASRSKIKRDLYRLGITAGNIFPDLEGLSSAILWQRTNIH